ncbi:helix-turn-helix domain-containing protein [Elioraea sp.]|uniref:helix-turn-helix domain-containing protein n=1 Tax=Elioraea sp. TaxID=2185103 RepID=UPI003F72C95B
MGEVQTAKPGRNDRRDPATEVARRRFRTHGLDGLKDLPPLHRGHPQTTPAEVVERIVALALEGRRVAPRTRSAASANSHPGTSGPATEGRPKATPPEPRQAAPAGAVSGRLHKEAADAVAMGCRRLPVAASFSREVRSMWIGTALRRVGLWRLAMAAVIAAIGLHQLASLPQGPMERAVARTDALTLIGIAGAAAIAALVLAGLGGIVLGVNRLADRLPPVGPTPQRASEPQPIGRGSRAARAITSSVRSQSA